MKIAGYLGNSAHAPANSHTALISAYTGGADVLYLSVGLTADRRIVLCSSGDVEAATGSHGRVSQMTLAELRRLDFSKTFIPRGSDKGEFHYFDPSVTGRSLPIDALDDLIAGLPRDVTLLLDIHSGDAETVDAAGEVIELLRMRRALRRSIIALENASTAQRLKRHQPDVRLALILNDEEAIEDTKMDDAEAVVVPVDLVWRHHQWTQDARKLFDRHDSGEFPLGLCLVAKEGVPDAALVREAGLKTAVWALSVESTFDLASLRPGYLDLKESFSGTTVNRARFALGYAKANQYCVVSWRDGVHVDISPYDGPLPGSVGDPIERRLSRLEWDLINVAREWPFYSGGGLGTTLGISDDFSAEVSYTVTAVGQATTLEMAVVNVDPGAHRGTPPTSFRDKDSFYDPHGAPPYVGVEHDEDDGFRINWNLGSEYDNNQYGRPVGDGRTPRGARLRLERRGPFFSAYYRDPVDSQGGSLPPKDWVCVGVARNESLNRTVYLRCVGKRWRQEKEGSPNSYEPVIPNRFTFRDLHIQCFPAREGD